MPAAYMAAVVYLVEQFGSPIDYLLETLHAPPLERTSGDPNHIMIRRLDTNRDDWVTI